MSPLWILSVVFVLLHVQSGEGYNGTANLRVDITCTVRADWCFTLTMYTVYVKQKVPIILWSKNTTILERSYCHDNRASVHPMFKNVEAESPYKLGFFGSYQLSHTCTKDGKLECMVLDHGFYIPFKLKPDYKEFLFPSGDVGVEKGTGGCKS
ncbi:hypothetical protein GCK72_013260 [Caenorhabditis remanei]|uniref:Uncharacterized protein n=1 Tax=Caenorhabditis remanei TaxID=31234 RepID=A0A6A5GQJ7_CAERE|nr:hypothetical protein GCK72_013260 [Caenorhabditis remanei]KAF1756806.1 hypothetical protein GCK72_013260 [Caenorhabditis remanei]